MASMLLSILTFICAVIARPANNTQHTVRSPEVAEVEYAKWEWFPRDVNNPNDPLSLQRQTAANCFFEEGIALATLAYLSVDEKDPIFLRYFEADDAALVKGIFKVFSGAADSNLLRGSLLFNTLWLFEGPSPYVPPTYCDKRGRDAVASENQNSRPYKFLQPNYMAVSLCPNVFRWPLLKDMGCLCLGGADSYHMNSGGAVMLHELMHWRFLSSAAPDFDNKIGVAPAKIYDYPYKETVNPDPPDGYGPQRAAALPSHGNGDARKNADNYRWYALNKYWTRKCGRPFKVSTNNAAGGLPPETVENTDAVVAPQEPSF